MAYTDNFDDDDNGGNGLDQRKTSREQIREYDQDCVEIAEIEFGKFQLETVYYGVNLHWHCEGPSGYSTSMHHLLNACRAFRAIVRSRTPARNYTPYNDFVCTLAPGHYVLMNKGRLLLWLWNKDSSSNLGPSLEPEVLPYVQKQSLTVKKLSECHPKQRFRLDAEQEPEPEPEPVRPVRPKKPREVLDDPEPKQRIIAKHRETLDE